MKVSRDLDLHLESWYTEVFCSRVNSIGSRYAFAYQISKIWIYPHTYRGGSTQMGWFWTNQCGGFVLQKVVSFGDWS
jgi:hypothetical protein